MRLVTFNIHHGTVASQGPVDPRRLADVCQAFDADILALQEVDQGTIRGGRADLAGVVAAECGMDHAFGASHRIPGGRYGNAVLVRGTVRRATTKGLPRVPFWRVFQERRTVLEAQVTVEGRPLSIAVTHLAVAEEINGAQLDRLLVRSAQQPEPRVIIGDLNRELVRVQPVAEAAGFHCVPHGPTQPAKRPRKTIDHVLLSPGFTVRSVEIRATEMSDHCALIVDVDWP
ncbi:MAG: endonuclease/exonuclease/phosphatase family protein [Aquihabitans sp.]